MLRVLSLVYPFKSLVLFSVPQAIITRLPQLCMEEAMVIMDLRMGIMMAITDQDMGTMAVIMVLGMGTMGATTTVDIMVGTIGVDIMGATMVDTAVAIMPATMADIGDS